MDLMAKILGRSVNTEVSGVERPFGRDSSYLRHQFQGDVGSNHRTSNHRPHTRYGNQGFTQGPRDENGNPV